MQRTQPLGAITTYLSDNSPTEWIGLSRFSNLDRHLLLRPGRFDRPPSDTYIGARLDCDCATRWHLQHVELPPRPEGKVVVPRRHPPFMLLPVQRSTVHWEIVMNSSIRFAFT